jgi:hypothetical protein
LWLFESQSVDEGTDTFVLQPVVPGLNMPLVKSRHSVLFFARGLCFKVYTVVMNYLALQDVRFVTSVKTRAKVTTVTYPLDYYDAEFITTVKGFLTQ